MDTIQINITDIPNEVTINVSNLQGPPGPSGATATLQEVVNNGNIVEFEFAKSPLGISKFFISDSAVNMQCNDGPGHGVVVASGGGVTLSGSNDNTGQSSTLEVAPGAIHAVAVDGEAKIETYSAGMGVDFNGLRTFVNKVWLYFTDMGLNWGQVKMDAAETTISHTQKIALNSPSVQKNGYEVATENYVDNLITGLNWKKSVLYSTNSGEDLSLTGLTAAIDGSLRFLSPTDRILVEKVVKSISKTLPVNLR